MFSSPDKVRQKKSVERMYLNYLKDKGQRVLYCIRIGFKSITTIEKVCAAFPELDMVNHMNRVKLVSEKK